MKILVFCLLTSTLLFGIFSITSCERDLIHPREDLGDFMKFTETITLADKEGIAYSFDLKKDGNTIICNRALIGSYLEGTKRRRMEIMLKDPSDLGRFIVEGKAWFIPNSFDPPIRLKSSELEAHILQRADGPPLGPGCFCEEVTDPEVKAECGYYAPADDCISNMCNDCDMEICDETSQEPIRIPGTRGGGVVILADTVLIFNGATDVVFGGRTKIKLTETDGSVYFERSYISTTNLFHEGYFNATGEDIDNVDTNLWVIPFDTTLQALQLSNRDCKPDGSGCSSYCDREEQKNGCFRCVCAGTGDCDWKIANNVIPHGVLVSANSVSELP